MGVEIERKWLVKDLPGSLSDYPKKELSQAYLCFSPVLRVRKCLFEGEESYELTYKGEGMIVRREENLPLDKSSYELLLSKHEGCVLYKTRYLIPIGKYTAELDIFSGDLEGFRLVEVEFSTEEESKAFIPPSWFGEDVSEDEKYTNSSLARRVI